MQKIHHRLLKSTILATLVCLALAVTCFATEEAEYVSNMYGTFWALVPPIIAITLALITKEVYSSLFVGIVAGALFYGNFNLETTMNTIINDGFIGALADGWNAGIFFFLVILGIMVCLINLAGGSAAFGRWATKNIKSRVGASMATFALGIIIFVDDYFNCLTVGSVMRPVTDAHKISRAKLAYLIDATAAPICMIAPISSWAAAVSSVADDAGISGITLFVRAIPYNFYSLLTFVFIIGLTVLKFDFGPMSIHEENAITKGDLFTSGMVQEDNESKGASSKGRVIDLVLPILVLIGLCIYGMVYVGGIHDGSDFITAFGDTDASVGLPWGALIALVITIVYFLGRRLMTLKTAMACTTKGFNAMVPAILILTCALTLKNITGLLGADVYVAGLMDGAAVGLANFLPAIIFLVSAFLAFSTGTSWGTFGILIPIITGIFAPSSELYIIGISAVLAGAVAGDHCSPISDTTIMASAGAQCDHINHVATQLPYVGTVSAVSFVCFILAGFIQSAAVVLPIGLVLTVIVLFILKGIHGKNSAASKYAK